MKDSTARNVSKRVAEQDIKLAALAARVEELEAALKAITETTVKLGVPNSAWDSWRECVAIAQKALNK